MLNAVHSGAGTGAGHLIVAGSRTGREGATRCKSISFRDSSLFARCELVWGFASYRPVCVSVLDGKWQFFPPGKIQPPF